jgi:transcriptional regulator with XRE-family HTH domain
MKLGGVPISATMKLADWLQQNDITGAALAVSAGLDPSTISRIISGERKPDWSTLDKIMAATGGAVTPNDFIPDEEQAPEPAPNEQAA